MPTHRSAEDAPIGRAYADYLASEHWQKARKRALTRAENRCQICNQTDQLDVHHRTYERLGRERPMDLTVLCHRCHALFHRLMPTLRGANPKPRKALTKRQRRIKATAARERRA